jgi:hypothetical protein
MSGQRSGLRLVVATAALAAAVLAQTAGAAASGCAPGAAKVLKSSGAARIYAESGTLYGCLGSRATRLGSLQGTHLAPATRVVRYVLASPYAGFDSVQMGVDTFASTVSIVDLQTGATVASAPATSAERRAESFISVHAMAINASGQLAWVGERSAIGVPHPTYELRVLSKPPSKLIEATLTPPTALRLRGHTLTWRTSPNGPLHDSDIAND